MTKWKIGLRGRGEKYSRKNQSFEKKKGLKTGGEWGRRETDKSKGKRRWNGGGKQVK